jgi:hypothetical protein
VMRSVTLTLACAACVSTAPPPKADMNDPVPASPWQLSYADGSANVYRWSQEQAGVPVRFVYDPVKPEESSTGRYSGGAPREEKVAPSDPRLVELWATVRALQADTAHHVSSRDKGTGLFEASTSKGTEKFIVAMGPSLTALEPLLAKFGAK